MNIRLVRSPAAAIAATTLLAIIVSIYCLSIGRVIIFQNLFYLPIIIACVSYGRRGFVFSVGLSFVYLALIAGFTRNQTVIIEALVRVGIFVMVAGTTAFLSMGRARVEEELKRNRDHLETRVRERTADLVAANELLRDGESKYRALFETADDAILLFTDGRWDDCNEGALKVFGCTREQILGEHPIRFSPLLQPDGRSSDEEAVKMINLAYAVGPQFFEWEHCRADGTTFPAEVCLNRLDLKGKPYIQAIVRDITDRKRVGSIHEFNAQRNQALMQLNQMGGATLQEITNYALEQAVLLTRSKIGYLAFLNEDESVLTMHAWSQSAMAECAIIDKPIIYPIEKTGLWGEAVRQRKPVITNDYSATNPLKKGIPAGHVALKRHVNVPVFDGSRIVIVAGVGNKVEEYNQADTQQLILLMEGMWRLLKGKRAEQDLLESEERFRTLSEAAFEAVVIHENGVIIDGNHAFAEMFGFGMDELKGKSVVDLVAPSSRVEVQDRIKTGYEKPYRVASLRKDGSPFTAENCGKRFPYHGRDVRVTTIRDITESDRAEQALKASEDRYRALLEASPDIVLFMDLEGRIKAASREALKVYGHKGEEEVIGRNALEWVFPEDRARAALQLREIMEGKAPGYGEYRGVRVDGSLVDIEANGQVVRNGEGAEVGLMLIVRVITERKKRDDREHLVRDVLQCINKSAVSDDLIGRILGLVKEYTGFDAVGIRLRKGDDFPYIAQDGFSNEFLLKENSLVVRDREGDVCKDENGNVRLECTCGLVIEGKTDPANALFTKGGSAWTGNSKPLLGIPIDQDPRLHPRNTCIHHGYSSIAIVPLRAGDQIVGILQLNDRREGRITEESVKFFEGLGNSIGIALTRKRMEEDLAQRSVQLESSNQELESFSYSVAHDLRAPLRAIDGFSRAVAEDYAERLDGEGGDLLTRIRATAQRMGSIIDDLLKLSRISRVGIRKEPTDLSALAASCVEALREVEPGREVTVAIAPGLMIEADPSLIRVVLENLIGNAWKFTRKTTDPRIEVDSLEKDGRKVYFIRDNGAGFDQGHAAKLFGAFQRLHSQEDFEGSGIGLATVRRIINRHGGRIWGEGNPGAGAAFYFTA